MFCHPVANCFHRRSPTDEDDNDTRESSVPVPTLTLPHGAAVASTDADLKDPGKSPKKKSDVESTVAAGGSSKTTAKDAKSPKNASAPADVPPEPEHAYISTFIIGLSFQKGSRFLDIEPPIQVWKDFSLSFALSIVSNFTNL